MNVTVEYKSENDNFWKSWKGKEEKEKKVVISMKRELKFHRGVDELTINCILCVKKICFLY